MGWETADQLKKGSWAHATGSHVIWKEKPLTSGKKGSWAQGSHVVWETADQVENGSWAQGEGKTAEKRGRKVQSPILGTGVILGVKTTQN